MVALINFLISCFNNGWLVLSHKQTVRTSLLTLLQGVEVLLTLLEPFKCFPKDLEERETLIHRPINETINGSHSACEPLEFLGELNNV
jgi:hypothetical protein